MKADPFAALFGGLPSEPKAKTRMRDLTKSEQHEFRKAHGRKGGMATAQDREHMAELGRLGGAGKERNRRNGGMR